MLLRPSAQVSETRPDPSASGCIGALTISLTVPVLVLSMPAEPCRCPEQVPRPYRHLRHLGMHAMPAVH